METPPGTATAADGTHPTGMHSPSKEIISGKNITTFDKEVLQPTIFSCRLGRILKL